MIGLQGLFALPAWGWLATEVAATFWDLPYNLGILTLWGIVLMSIGAWLILRFVLADWSLATEEAKDF